MFATTLRLVCLLFCLALPVVSGCSSNSGLVKPPELTEEEKAAAEAKRAEYSKAMKESYEKNNGR